MTQTYDCPECGHRHTDPADARFVLAVLCFECETALALDARATEARTRPRPTGMERTAA